MKQNDSCKPVFKNSTIHESINFWISENTYYTKVFDLFKPLIQLVDVISNVNNTPAKVVRNFIDGLTLMPFIGKDSGNELLLSKADNLLKPMSDELMKYFNSNDWKKVLIESEIIDFELEVLFREHVPVKNSLTSALLQYINQKGIISITGAEILQINEEFLDEIEKKSWKAPKQNYEYPDSTLEWATVFFYADEKKLISNNPNLKARMEEFMNKHNISTTITTFNSRYYDVKNRIYKLHNYPIDRLDKLIPFLAIYYKKAVSLVVNDIDYLKKNPPDNKSLTK